MGHGEHCLRKLPCFYIAGAVVIRVLHILLLRVGVLSVFARRKEQSKTPHAKVLILLSFVLNPFLRIMMIYFFTFRPLKRDGE